MSSRRHGTDGRRWARGARRWRRWPVAALSIWLCGCVTLVPATTLSPPRPVARTIPGTAWIGEVTISDPDMTRRETMAASLAASLRDYVEQARYFGEVKSLPGKPAPDDYILDFDFNPCRQSRSLLPYYVPAAFFTLTFYIWFGGPIYSDTIDIAGTLTVKRPDGTVLARSQAAVKDTTRRGLYDDDYLTFSSIEERTAVIAELLDRATASLPGGGA